jgi:hypothetical protein
MRSRRLDGLPVCLRMFYSTAQMKLYLHDSHVLPLCMPRLGWRKWMHWMEPMEIWNRWKFGWACMQAPSKTLGVLCMQEVTMDIYITLSSFTNRKLPWVNFHACTCPLAIQIYHAHVHGSSHLRQDHWKYFFTYRKFTGQQGFTSHVFKIYT